MKTILRKSYFKKILITLCITMCGWFVYAGGVFNTFSYQVKIVKIYPNPASSVINFEFTGEIDKSSTLQIYSFTGKKIIDQSLSANKITVTLDNNFYRGLYIFQLRDKTGRIIETGKFQVVK
jgi:hypothetical protein